jgi:hypothetical protein
MPLNSEFVGRVYPPTEPHEVSIAELAGFATALGTDPSEVAPPTFPIVLSMRAEELVLFDPALGLDFSRVVHRQQEFTYTRPIQAGDRLTVTVTVTGIDTVVDNDIVTTRGDIRSVTGELVCTAVSTMVARNA